MKYLSQTFNEWIKYFVGNEKSEMFDFLKERMAFASPDSNYTTVRYEIHNCLVLGMNQAALTLTNHYLERLLKISIIEHKLNQKLDKIDEYSKAAEIHVNNHGSKDLEQSISAAKI